MPNRSSRPTAPGQPALGASCRRSTTWTPECRACRASTRGPLLDGRGACVGQSPSNPAPLGLQGPAPPTEVSGLATLVRVWCEQSPSARLTWAPARGTRSRCRRSVPPPPMMRLTGPPTGGRRHRSVGHCRLRARRRPAYSPGRASTHPELRATATCRDAAEPPMAVRVVTLFVVAMDASLPRGRVRSRGQVLCIEWL